MFSFFKKSPKENTSPAPTQEGWLTRLKSGLKKTRDNLHNKVSGLFTGRLNDEWFNDLEEALILADVGVKTAQLLIKNLKIKAKEERVEEAAALKPLLRSMLIDLLSPLERTFDPDRAKPFVLVFAGVNGAGKTTSIGKLAQHLKNHNYSVLLAAGDTFRAAAVAQLVAWGERNQVDVITQEKGDSAAVIFDAIQAAKARQIDVVLADTAGRLPTQLHLMEEIKKVKRVIAKADPSAPHEVILVLDANTGQNAITQVKAFDDALQLTGLIITKLDGTARGGVVAAIAGECPKPILFIGVGEQLDDMQPFSANSFVDALLE
ncbi:MAG: signal recognition particle-docking protein FtsY [Betaproteobacteria bacterium]|uniref:signal recognition particle-docking protein FtsY n=1 Tax=Ferrovum sp. PN-J185 TaxID=1356306 RepID=UPI00079CC725|nr:signal recognition particle-docking protein FtsY [Ferrovum sp. PN-J185]KXW55637.1 signal recognition particle receptor FtsY [Ferrovum sp. PN-J185]MDE2056192.1 signal recognition particle-docking protein FtsY [Betaproteobacteria bacterium]